MPARHGFSAVISFFYRQMATEPAIGMPAASATGQRHCTSGLRRTRPDTSIALVRVSTFASAALARALALTAGRLLGCGQAGRRDPGAG